MSYQLLYTEKSIKQLKKLDRSTQKLITNYMKNLGLLEEPRAKGKALSANWRGFWRYRIGDYRAICEIDDGRIVIVVIDVGHRKDIYK
ncbi:type II toxin-antitoxin system RelE/ParE family toxin [Alkalibacter rhizosphaerae]|uniref:Type II toxin-antitoxin system RelE/ParE family toxin n=1 Tax=Alkalibacter rhizosphaerae TaxID=2815577 RepID=A0A974XGH6_9FIRM|nr:type II toxin-antitoxin system RelE/ParE family toxin [Alkalibacter rhizosphaerae]QSX09261.1 type II toxin-antitoxin system RelE/ParE family toxin [Alkalibacter rhizosphaerae]